MKKELKYAAWKTVENSKTGELELAVKITEHNPQEVIIKLYTYEGLEIDSSMKDEEVQPWMWQCFVDGIDNKLIFRVEQPTFDYSRGTGSHVAKVKVYSHVLESSDESM